MAREPRRPGRARVAATPAGTRHPDLERPPGRQADGVPQGPSSSRAWSIFPAAGFVEMVLEAGVQWFEGRAFAVEDFEIRKPLILPDPVSGVHLELSYDPAERTFVIQSKFEQGSTWSVHVVGSDARRAHGGPPSAPRSGRA